MKKIFLLLFVILNLYMFANADVKPYYVNSLRRYGIGFSEVKSPLVMRQTPSKDGKILETLNFDFFNEPSCLINSNRCTLDEIFAVYSEKRKIAMLTTLDTTEGWNLVCFNQGEMPVCGWVSEKENKFFNWSDFFNIYGKKFGLYLFNDLKKPDKVLFSGPIKQTNSVGVLEMPKKIVPWLVRGNWMLIKASDFGGKEKTGWINYRGDDGKLKLFVNF